MRHVGHEQAVGEANQVLFFNAFEGYRISHPVPGGDASLTLVIGEPMLNELAPAAFLRDTVNFAFRPQRLRIDARTQALVALLRHSLRQKVAEPLEAETLALTLVQRALGPRTTHAAGATVGRQRLVDRIKLVLASDLARRWTLAEIAAEVRGSPVYLTQVFKQVEGLPLYRYQLRLRLARALDLLAHCDDLTDLSLAASLVIAISAPPSAKLTAALPRNSGGRRCIANRAPRRLLKLRNQETCMPAVLCEGFPELRGQHGFFLPRLDPVAHDDQDDSRDASPLVNRQSSADRGEIDSGINGMPKMSVGPCADELVVLFESNSGAPVLSQVPASPKSDSDADPGKRNAYNGKCVCSMDNAMTKYSDLRCVAEEQDEASNFQKKDAVTRREGFPTDGPACLQCARRPVCDEDDPRTFNEVAPDHASSTVDTVGMWSAVCGGINSVHY